MLRVLLLSCIPLVAAAEELRFPAPATRVEMALPLGNGSLFTRIHGSVDRERFPLWTRLTPPTSVADPGRPGLGIGGREAGAMTFEWLDAEGDATRYERRLDTRHGISTVTFQRGGAGFTWTTFLSRPDDLMVLHVRTDKPGFLSFRVKLAAHGKSAAVEDRRVLSVTDGDFSARLWVYPMESEVTPGENEITVKGEGEALLLLAAATDPAKVATLPDRITRLAGEGHPDTFALWSALLENQKKSGADVDFAGYRDGILRR